MSCSKAEVKIQSWSTLLEPHCCMQWDTRLEAEGVAAEDADSARVRELQGNRAAVTSWGCG